jgi:hypothetical protein
VPNNASVPQPAFQGYWILHTWLSPSLALYILHASTIQAF